MPQAIKSTRAPQGVDRIFYCDLESRSRAQTMLSPKQAAPASKRHSSHSRVTPMPSVMPKTWELSSASPELRATVFCKRLAQTRDEQHARPLFHWCCGVWLDLSRKTRFIRTSSPSLGWDMFRAKCWHWMQCSSGPERDNFNERHFFCMRAPPNPASPPCSPRLPVLLLEWKLRCNTPSPIPPVKCFGVWGLPPNGTRARSWQWPSRDTWSCSSLPSSLDPSPRTSPTAQLAPIPDSSLVHCSVDHPHVEPSPPPASRGIADLRCEHS